MSRVRSAVVSALVLLVGRRHRRRRPKPEETRLVPALPPNPAAELAVLALLGLSSLSAIGFILVYAFADSLPAVTPLLGATIGLAFLFLTAALVVVGLKLVPTEEIAEEYPPHEHPGEQQVIAELMDESGTRFTRKRLFKLGLLGAGGTLGLALLTPAVSFGPLFHVGDFLRTPWRRGRRLVDEAGRPYKAADIEKNDFYLAFPEGLNDEEKEETAASLVVIRLDPDSSTCRRTSRATTRTGSSPTRASAPTPAARSRSTGRRSSSPTSRGRRSSARATTRPSTPRPVAR